MTAQVTTHGLLTMGSTIFLSPVLIFAHKLKQTIQENGGNYYAVRRVVWRTVYHFFDIYGGIFTVFREMS